MAEQASLDMGPVAQEVEQTPASCAEVTDAASSAAGVALVPTEAPPSMLSLISALARDPAVDHIKLEALLRMQREVEGDQARRDYAEAFARLQPRLPRIKKDGVIDIPGDATKGKKGGKIHFAKWETIDSVIRPLLTEEGFALTFATAMRPGEGGGLIVTARLRHRGGHVEECAMPVPLDTGPGRNNLQAYGSSLSYGKRYAACALLNVVTEGEDTDGNLPDPITEAQVKKIDDLLLNTKSDRLGFLQYMGAAEIANIEKSDFARAINILTAKQKKQEAAGR